MVMADYGNRMVPVGMANNWYLVFYILAYYQLHVYLLRRCPTKPSKSEEHAEYD